MYNTDLPVNYSFQPIQIPEGYCDYCHIFPGLEIWRLEQDGYDIHVAFLMAEEIMASLPECQIDFDIVEEGFELLRQTISLEDCDEVDDLWTSPLSLSHGC